MYINYTKFLDAKSVEMTVKLITPNVIFSHYLCYRRKVSFIEKNGFSLSEGDFEQIGVTQTFITRHAYFKKLIELRHRVALKLLFTFYDKHKC